MGLLLLRGAIGIVALLQGVLYLTDGATSQVGMWLYGLIALATGAALLIGIFTPIAGILVGLGAIGLRFSLLAAPRSSLLDEKLSAVLAAIIGAAIVFLGPGAFSLDARFFGRREIIIPPRSRS